MFDVRNRLVAAPIIEQIFNNAIEPPIIVGISSEKLLKIFNDFKMVVIPLIAAYTVVCFQECNPTGFFVRIYIENLLGIFARRLMVAF